ncbi:MAG: hypothetical protein B7Z39_03035 [Novosphingobium sp. 12-64-8]|nr:MAG: hypothetical protein B7Z39_03035 [Novosphingobium sp. 12-64-8]
MARLTVNNQPLEFRLEPDTPLLWALRDAANLTGTKYGCGTGECGACMVIVDGQAMPSCTLSLGEAEGRSVTTIEGLSTDRNHPVQQAFVVALAGEAGFVLDAAPLIHPRAGQAEGGYERMVLRFRKPMTRGAVLSAQPNVAAPGASL